MNIVKIFEDSIKDTIKGLTGEELILTNKVQAGYDELDMGSSFCNAKVLLSGDYGGAISISFSTNIATSISSLMFAEDGQPKEKMNSDDLDSIKELISNILASSKTSIMEENSSSFSITMDDISFHQDEKDATEAWVEAIYFDAEIKNNKGKIAVLLDGGSTAILENKKANSSDDEEDNILSDHIAEREIKNIKRILDIKIKVKVRIGSRIMLLRDVTNMDLGSIIELDRLINDPLDIIVDEKIVGTGEVVIVDGNFGIKVITMVDQKTRLESIRIM